MLSEYIQQLVKGIDKGLFDTEYTISPNDKILLELSLINTKASGGGLKIHVADISKKANKEELSKIEIPIRRKRYF